MSRAKFTSVAEEDLREIALYIARDNPERGAAFVDELIAHCHRIADHPNIGRRRTEFGADIRSVPHGRYVIFYRIVEGGVEVRHVLHGARDIRGLPAGGEE